MVEGDKRLMDIT